MISTFYSTTRMKSVELIPHDQIMSWSSAFHITEMWGATHCGLEFTILKMLVIRWSTEHENAWDSDLECERYCRWCSGGEREHLLQID